MMSRHPNEGKALPVNRGERCFLGLANNSCPWPSILSELFHFPSLEPISFLSSTEHDPIPDFWAR
jgi:hypothetical protein